MADSTRVLRDPHAGTPSTVTLEQAGPRERVFFEPAEIRAAILTAGGLCPGLNDVIRGLVFELHHGYGVRDVLGVRHGYRGLAPGAEGDVGPLRPADVADIHLQGGTVLGTSRSRHDATESCDALERHGIDVLFCIGGDGTLRGAAAIDRELRRRGQARAVVGIPKTIDNDIPHCSRTFGFMTAVEEATRSISAAHVEARGHRGGVGLVKLMGREAGFIAASATLALPDVNYTLIPEVPFELDGERGLLSALRQRLRERGHAVVVVAEGAGPDLFSGADLGTDASGNRRLPDVGRALADAIRSRFEDWGDTLNLKYIDPSYNIRSRPANATDRIFCGHLAKMAAHAGLAGKTGVMVSTWNGLFVHVPIDLTLGEHRRVKPDGLLWQSVLASTGQPDLVNESSGGTEVS